MNHQLKKLPKNTFEATITIPWVTLQKEYESEFSTIQSQLEIEGFRKGKAPKNVAVKHIKKDIVYEQVIRNLLPKLYQEFLQKEKLQPITQPKVELIKAQENEDWQVKITLATKPDIKLKDYKSKVKALKNSGNKEEIWIPGKDKSTPAPGNEEEKQKMLNAILALILKEVEIQVPDILIEAELETRLAQLVDDVQKIGLTTQSYLQSKGLSMDDLKKKYTKEIEDMYKLEFVLLHIADEEKIEVQKEDLDKLFVSIPNEDERQKAQENSYFYASLLRKQKTLDFLASL